MYKRTKLETMIRKAEKRELNGDHLNEEEKRKIVELFKEKNPSWILPGHINDAFVQIVLG